VSSFGSDAAVGLKIAALEQKLDSLKKNPERPAANETAKKT
jgi:hypothetical protein